MTGANYCRLRKSPRCHAVITGARRKETKREGKSGIEMLLDEATSMRRAGRREGGREEELVRPSPSRIWKSHFLLLHRKWRPTTNEGTDNRSRGRSHQKRMYFLLSSTAKDLWPSPLAAAAPAPAACLLIAGKETTERKRERKGKERKTATGPLTARSRGEGGEWGSGGGSGAGPKGVRSVVLQGCSLASQKGD